MKLLSEAVPKHLQAYALPKIHLKIFKQELKHLIKLGILSPQGMSKWESPTYSITKKDERVRWINDLRELNTIIV